MSGTLFVVATPIGNLEDVSARAVRVLREAAIIAAEDTRRTGHLLARYGIQTPTTSLHEHNEAAKTAGLLARLQAGESVALVSDAGTPTLSDPGAHLIGEAIAAGLTVEPIPGPSAILALLSVAGLPTESFTFLGFPPLKAKDRMDWFDQLGSAGRTVVFFESPHRILSTLAQIQDVFGNCHIVVGRELTKVHEQVLRGPVSAVMSALGSPRGEFCVGLNLVESQKHPGIGRATDADIAHEFGLLTKSARVSRRQAVIQVARKLNLPPNAVYAAVERAKDSVK
jgi:16S rRNA (cytidine1402-2'-O)-methyltransferase